MENGPTGGTPITADELTRIDTGVKLAGDIADTAVTPDQLATALDNKAAGLAGATVIKYRLDVDAADAIAFPAGATLDLDAAIIEQTTTIGKPFDGDNPPT